MDYEKAMPMKVYGMREVPVSCISNSTQDHHNGWLLRFICVVRQPTCYGFYVNASTAVWWCSIIFLSTILARWGVHVSHVPLILTSVCLVRCSWEYEIATINGTGWSVSLKSKVKEFCSCRLYTWEKFWWFLQRPQVVEVNALNSKLSWKVSKWTVYLVSGVSHGLGLG